MINVGMIPEDFSFTDVYTFHVDELPGLLVARRASADELIWDADGGFTDQWRDRSSMEGNETDGYDFHVARRAFSVAGLPIFASAGAGVGGGGSGAIGTTIPLSIGPGLNSDVEIPDVHAVRVVAASGDSDSVVDSIERPPVQGGGDPAAEDYHSIIWVNDSATNSMILRPGAGTAFNDIVTPDGDDYVLAPREGAVLVYLHYVSAWTVHPLATKLPAASDGVLTSTGGVLSWEAAAGTGDVVGPASAVADRVATFNGTTGKIIKDGGKTIAQIESSAAASAVATAATYTDSKVGWQKACDFNFTQMANQTVTDGSNTLDGKTWTAANVSSASSIFRILNGTGLQIKCNTVNSAWYYNGFNCAHIYITLADLLPVGWTWGVSELMVSAQFENASASPANYDLGGVAIEKTTYVLNGAWTHKMYAGYTPSYVRYWQVNMEAAEGGIQASPTTYKVDRIHFRGADYASYFHRNTAAADADPNDDVFLKKDWDQLGIWKPSSSLTFTAVTTQAPTRIKQNADACLRIACQSGNTNGNSFLTVKRLRVEYKL